MPLEPNAKQTAQAEGADFARQASTGQTGFLQEVWLFLRANKKWWLIPLILVIGVLGVLVFFSGTPVATAIPFVIRFVIS